MQNNQISKYVARNSINQSENLQRILPATSGNRNKITSQNVCKNASASVTNQYKKSSGSKSTESQNGKLAPVFVQVINCKCWVSSDCKFTVRPSEYHSKLIDVFKSIPSKSYDPQTKNWTFSIKDYELFQKRCEVLKPYIITDTIPRSVLNLCCQPKTEVDRSCLVSVEPKLMELLLPFQKDGVCFGISKQGRVLIADEMGLGKTYQALAIADFYREDWPLLIVTTASTRGSWLNHVRTVLSSVAFHHIECLTANTDYFGDAKILITSYTMLEKNIDKLVAKRFGVLIFDESHTLKNQKAKCTMMADRLAKQALRVILLSGTPALSRPVELFTQLKIIDRSFSNFMEFTTRYCAGKQSTFGWDASGQSNLEELNVVLSKKFMIRRTKADVLPELAEKSRETVILDPSLIYDDNEATAANLTTFANNLSQCKNGRMKEEILLQYYTETAKVKKRAVCKYVESLVKNKLKFIVFAHHALMINALCSCLEKLNTNFIRIDGSTRNDLRNEYVNKFQKDTSCRVAVLSLKACNAGITLTAADLVIFAELDWNPSTLAQAESRVHRIGQEGTVICRYLIANNTADDVIWKMLKTKQDVLNKAGIFCEDLQNAECVPAPTTSHSIKKYFISTTEETKKTTSVSVLKEENVLEKHSSIEPERKTESIENDYKALLLDEDDDDFRGLDF